MKTLPTTYKLLIGLGVATVLTGLAWWHRPAVLTWYYVRQLQGADERSREGLVKQLARLDDAAVPALVEQLRRPDPLACANTEAALVGLSAAWDADDPRSARLAQALEDGFGDMSPMGQGSALLVLAHLVRRGEAKALPASLSRAAGNLVRAGEDRVDLRGQAILLATPLLERVPQGQWLDTGRALATKGLADPIPKTRQAAIHLVVRTPLREEPPLLRQIAPLLRDEAADVRKAALVALAPSRDVASEDDLLPLLHDESLEVRQLCEVALRSRGLSDEHIEMARLISDERPQARLKVLERLGYAGDLDPTVWLRRLSQDPASAVRAAAARAAGQQPNAPLADRLREMAQQDPSETVRQTARHYLGQKK
jgi:HEAT repeat protein